MNPYGNPIDAPTHIEEAMKLDADGYANLFSIRMFPAGEPEVLLNFTPQKTVTWQGQTWSNMPIALTDYVRNTRGEMARPKMTIANPEGVFSEYVHARWMDNAEVVRLRVLGQHLDADVNSYLKNTWKVRKVMNLSRVIAVFELGDILDGPSFVLPAKAYYPPDYPTVSI